MTPPQHLPGSHLSTLSLSLIKLKTICVRVCVCVYIYRISEETTPSVPHSHYTYIIFHLLFPPLFLLLCLSILSRYFLSSSHISIFLFFQYSTKHTRYWCGSIWEQCSKTKKSPVIWLSRANITSRAINSFSIWMILYPSKCFIHVSWFFFSCNDILHFNFWSALLFRG